MEKDVLYAKVWDIIQRESKNMGKADQCDLLEDIISEAQERLERLENELDEAEF